MSNKNKVKQKIEILYISFNQNKDCLAVGMSNGYRIYDLTSKIKSLRETGLNYYEKYIDGGINIIEMLDRSNVLALVGNEDDKSKNQKFNKTKLVISDEEKNEKIVDIDFNNGIKSLKITKDLIVVSTDIYLSIISLPSKKVSNFGRVKEIYYNLNSKINLIFSVVTIIKEKEISNSLVAYSNEKMLGKIIIQLYEPPYEGKEPNQVLLNGFNSDKNQNVNFLEFNKKGTLIGIIAEKNECIKIFKTNENICVYNVILSNEIINPIFLSFDNNDSKDKDNEFLCLTHKGGIIEIFNLKDFKESNNNIKKITNYWSYFYTPENKGICCFKSDNEQQNENNNKINNNNNNKDNNTENNENENNNKVNNNNGNLENTENENSNKDENENNNNKNNENINKDSNNNNNSNFGYVIFISSKGIFYLSKFEKNIQGNLAEKIYEHSLFDDSKIK